MTGPSLALRHRSMLLEGSVISPEAVEERGYRTVEAKAELERLGFGRAQRKTPGLLIPLYGPGGGVVLHQFRPDEPRTKKGKPVKYETPAGSRMVLDVPPAARDDLGDPSVPLYVTEGVKKGDALVSAGLCAIAIIGVWNWRGTNAKGGKVALPEWENVALNGRRVYIVFDSDVMEKREVHAALSRFKQFLESRGAKVAMIYLPSGRGGEKQGVDDYLASGHTVDEFRSLATTDLRKLPSNSDRNPTQAETLIGYAEEAELFHAPDGEAFATLGVDGHRGTWSMKSRRFKQWLHKRFYDEQGRAPSAQALTDALRTIESKAVFDGPERRVNIRVAKDGDRAIYVDLVNDAWEAVEVTASGWRVVSSDAVPVKFVRKDNAAALPHPVAGGTVEMLRALLNVSGDKDFRLLVAWTIGAFNPDGPYPVLALQGEQGSAKSTTVRVLRSLTDPALEPLRAPPRNERDLAIAASGNWTPALDNLSGVKPWLSDALCRLATGGGFATRELYSDDREIIFSQKRPVILNGIDSLAAAGDLRDRSLIVELPPLPPEKKCTEREFFRELEAVRPKVLGALLDAVSAALRNREAVEFEELPRMADFAVWVKAAEEALSWSPGTFIEAYTSSRVEADELALDGDPVAVAVRAFMSDRKEWSGTATELLLKLGGLVDEGIRHSRAWPKAANALSNGMKRLAPDLRGEGIEYGDGRDPGGSRARRKYLKRVPTKDRPDRPDRFAEREGATQEENGYRTMQGGTRRLRDGAAARTGPNEGPRDGHSEILGDDRDDPTHRFSEPMLSEGPSLPQD